MKILTPLTFITILLVSACTDSTQDKVDTKTSVTTPPTSLIHNYQCDSGETIAATYPSTGSTTIQYMGSRYTLHIAISASGARYVGDELEWWTKGSGLGSEGTLFHHMADGTSGEIIELCREF